MEPKSTNLTDADLNAALMRARRMRALAIRDMGQAFAGWVKTRFAALARLLDASARKHA